MADTVTVPRADWEALQERVTDLEDAVAALSQRLGNAPTIPGPVMNAELDGVHPVKAWRDHYGLGEADLAARAGLTPDRLAAVEAGDKPADTEAFHALAHALNVPVDFLSPVADDATTTVADSA